MEKIKVSKLEAEISCAWWENPNFVVKAAPALLRLARAAHKLDRDGFKGDEWYEALSAFDFTD